MPQTEYVVAQAQRMIDSKGKTHSIMNFREVDIQQAAFTVLAILYLAAVDHPVQRAQLQSVKVLRVSLFVHVLGLAVWHAALSQPLQSFPECLRTCL